MRRYVSPIIGALLFAAGCAKPEAQIVGKWQIDTSILEKSMTADQLAKMNQFVKAITLEFKADKTYAMTVTVGKPNELDGTYTLSDRIATLTATKMNGQDLTGWRDPRRGIRCRFGKSHSILTVRL